MNNIDISPRRCEEFIETHGWWDGYEGTILLRELMGHIVRLQIELDTYRWLSPNHKNLKEKDE